MDGSQGPRCYQATQVQNAYNVTPLLNRGIDGTGRTIVVIDAYGSPSMASDLQDFDAAMGLPAPNFSQIAPAGAPPAFDPNDGNQIGWGVETSLDVEWAHAIAPGANIVLAVAPSNNDSDLLNVLQYVVAHHVGDVITQSYGEAEDCMDPALLAEQHQAFAAAAQEGITVFASSGDSGASQPACDPNSTAAQLAVSTPASDPLVTGVGGTTLTANTSTGAYIGETAWTEPFGCNPPAIASDDVNCSGGGFSSLFSRPAFQASTYKGAHALTRGVPDVAYNAGASGGVLVHIGFYLELLGYPADAPIFFIVGGTSAGSPQWAGLAADGDQLAGRALGDINPALYAISNAKRQYSAGLHDITTGNNDVSEIGDGYNAGTGWDPVTGLGTPNAANLLPLLVGHTS
ncbi:MAG TPA: S53 family peptidase [Solirubrobacteraceae bacterium]|nr:S53 family peptidase [Solirubrobacteraceae bacterium]